MNRIYPAAILLLISVVISCNKPQPKGITTFVTSDSLFKFVNMVPIEVKLDLYRSQADMNNNTNVAYSFTVPGNGQATIPFRLFDTSATYYYDYYSSDFTFTQWGNDIYDTLGTRFGQFTQTKFQIPSYSMSQLRPAFLKGNNASVTWRAVDFYDFSYSEAWSSLSANDQYKVLVINKSLICQLYHKNTSGTIVADTLSYISRLSSSAPLCGFYFYVNGTTEGELYNAPQAAFMSPVRTSTDTILLRDQSNGYYAMVPQ